MNITLNGHEIFLHSSGAALWRERGIAIAADLHLEKGSHFARRGFFLPPYDSHETLSRLLALCEAEAVRQLVILGDCFHDAQGFERLGRAGRLAFEKLLGFGAVWIRGNHDGAFVPDGLPAHESYEAGGLTFRHEAETGAAAGEVSGHFHPKIKITHKGSRLMRPCFVEDGARLILPAFGAYAGGLDIADPAIRSLFAGPLRCHALGQDRIYSFTERSA